MTVLTLQEPVVGDGGSARGGGEDCGRLPGPGEGGDHPEHGQVQQHQGARLPHRVQADQCQCDPSQEGLHCHRSAAL